MQPSLGYKIIFSLWFLKESILALHILWHKHSFFGTILKMQDLDKFTNENENLENFQSGKIIIEIKIIN